VAVLAYPNGWSRVMLIEGVHVVLSLTELAADERSARLR
jgi:hypothetical protein